MNRLWLAWTRLRGSLWFVPSLLVFASIAAAVLLVEAQGQFGDGLARDWPRVFGAGADGSRAMLSSIATAMVTVAGVVFSITIVTLSLTASQYSPRILRNFMRDQPTQLVLGIFMGVFAYCLVVLRTVRAQDDVEFIPSLAVLAGMGYALVGIGFLIYFIHHVAQSIQASSIAARIHDDTAAAIDRLYPEMMGEAASQPSAMPDLRGMDWTTVAATHGGYVTAIDAPGVMALAVRCDRLLRLHAAVGDFITEGAPLASLGGPAGVDDDAAGRLRDCIVLGRQRTVEQDAGYGLQQMVDVAVKALSPGINDPTTACLCIDQLSALLRRLAKRAIPSPYRSSEGRLRVIAHAADFERLVANAFEPLVRHSRGDLAVIDRLLLAVETIAAATADKERRAVLAAVVRDVQAQLRALRPRAGAAPRLATARVLRRRLMTGGRPGEG